MSNGQTLDIIVVGCTRLKNTEFLTRQDPYVIMEYGNTKIRTSTCTDGGKNPIFQEKYQIPLIEGLHEINLCVWNSNTFRPHAYIGGGRVQLQKVLSEGFDDSSWMLQTNSNKFAGEVKLIMHFSEPTTASPPPYYQQPPICPPPQQPYYPPPQQPYYPPLQQPYYPPPQQPYYPPPSQPYYPPGAYPRYN